MRDKIGKQKNLLWLWPASESKTFSTGNQNLNPKHKTPLQNTIPPVTVI
jgi:hypothetical protein